MEDSAQEERPFWWAPWVHRERLHFPDGRLYMTRHRLTPNAWRSHAGQVVLQHFHLGDDHQPLHDHPFNFVSLILRGGYYEVGTPLRDLLGRWWLPRSEMYVRNGDAVTRYWFGPGRIVRRRTTDKHAVTLRRAYMGRATECTTIMWRSAKKKEWGFYPDGTHMPMAPWQEYWQREHEAVMDCRPSPVLPSPHRVHVIEDKEAYWR